MTLQGEYAPSASERARNQVEEIEQSGGTTGTTMRGMPVVVITMRGVKSGKIRKTPLMRVEHNGEYALVASMGGAPEHPQWYHNLRANPRIELQDGTSKQEMVVREVEGEERAQWWERSVEAFPDYADYEKRTDRLIPVLVASPVD